MKGFFTRLADIIVSPNFADIVVGKDGGLYEIRQTPVGLFSVKLDKVYRMRGEDNIKEGFVSALPSKIPLTFLYNIIAFFRNWAKIKVEVKGQIFWSKEKKSYFVYVPTQRVGRYEVIMDTNVQLEHESLLVLEIHSHHYMGAFFSPDDNECDLATGLYGVIGELGNPIPTILLRYSCGGIYRSLELSTIFETTLPSDLGVFNLNSYPEEWDRQVTVLGGEENA
jgi:PRTRC genetic system protein A